jgi:hypothetical protein
MPTPNYLIKQASERLEEAQDRLFFLAEAPWTRHAGSRTLTGW